MFRRSSYVNPNDNDSINLPIRSEYAFYHSLLNPCRVACHLIRIGHEPIPPTKSTTILHLIGALRSPIAFYPNAFTYSFYLLRKYGYWKVFTCGFFSSFCLDVAHETIAFMNNRYLVQRLLESSEWIYDEEVISNDQSELLMRSIARSSGTEFSHLVRYFFLTRAYEIFITQPFFVIMIRQIAGLISEDEGYAWFPHAVISIYRDEGVLGFFSGLVPRLLLELSRLGLNILMYSIITRSSNDRIGGFPNNVVFLLNLLADVAVNMSTYPLQVVGSVMALNGSQISAPEVVQANSFNSWRECLRYLISEGLQFRGYFPFWRRAPPNASTCPTVIESTPSAA